MSLLNGITIKIFTFFTMFTWSAVLAMIDFWIWTLQPLKFLGPDPPYLSLHIQPLMITFKESFYSLLRKCVLWVLKLFKATSGFANGKKMQATQMNNQASNQSTLLATCLALWSLQATSGFTKRLNPNDRNRNGNYWLLLCALSLSI